MLGGDGEALGRVSVGALAAAGIDGLSRATMNMGADL